MQAEYQYLSYLKSQWNSISVKQLDWTIILMSYMHSDTLKQWNSYSSWPSISFSTSAWIFVLYSGVHKKIYRSSYQPLTEHSNSCASTCHNSQVFLSQEKEFWQKLCSIAMESSILNKNLFKQQILGSGKKKRNSAARRIEELAKKHSKSGALFTVLNKVRTYRINDGQMNMKEALLSTIALQ